jgi:hypothetical protein
MGVLYFSGKNLPRTPHIFEETAIAVPTDFKKQIYDAAKRGVLRAFLEVVTEPGYWDVLIKPGDETCIVSFYDGLWYAFAHSATTLALLSARPNSPRTFIFLPRILFELEQLMHEFEIFEQCSSVIIVDGLGVCKDGLDTNYNSISIGCMESRYFGSPFDTPDKFRSIHFLRQLNLLNALLK